MQTVASLSLFKNSYNQGSSLRDAAETNPTKIHQDGGSIPGLGGLGIRHYHELCGVGCRRGSDLVAPIRPLAWELPCAMGVVLKSGGKKVVIIPLLINYKSYTCKVFRKVSYAYCCHYSYLKVMALLF